MDKFQAIPVALYHTNFKLWKLGSKFSVMTTGLFCKLFFKCFHDVTVYPSQFQLDQLIKNNSKRSVITVSNHMRYVEAFIVYLPDSGFIIIQ